MGNAESIAPNIADGVIDQSESCIPQSHVINVFILLQNAALSLFLFAQKKATLKRREGESKDDRTFIICEGNCFSCSLHQSPCPWLSKPKAL